MQCEPRRSGVICLHVGGRSRRPPTEATDGGHRRRPPTEAVSPLAGGKWTPFRPDSPIFVGSHCARGACPIDHASVGVTGSSKGVRSNCFIALPRPLSSVVSIAVCHMRIICHHFRPPTPSLHLASPAVSIHAQPRTRSLVSSPSDQTLIYNKC